jgi:hypothetical protein
MLALKTNCIHPETKKPYIKSAIGGKDNSTEGIQVGSPSAMKSRWHKCLMFELCTNHNSTFKNGVTHVFVSEFENEEDREYYLNKDPAHLEFVKSLSGVVEKGQVVDFTPGVF